MTTIQITFANNNPIQRDGDIIYVNFDDGLQWQFENFLQFQSWVNSMIENFGADGLRAVACKHLLTLDPSMETPAIWAEKTFALDAEQSDFTNVFLKV